MSDTHSPYSTGSPPSRLDVNWDHIVHFIVEGHASSVPAHRFIEESELFASKFINGTTPGTLVAIQTATAREFRTLLELLYPRLSDSTSIEFTKHQWLDVLRLSTMWHFNNFRQLAIEKLTPQIDNAVDLILLGRQVYVANWVKSGYNTLVCKREPITEEEGSRIGYQCALRLWLLRYGLHEEAAHVGDCWTGSLAPFNTPLPLDLGAIAAIERSFKEELDMLRMEDFRRAARENLGRGVSYQFGRVSGHPNFGESDEEDFDEQHLSSDESFGSTWADGEDVHDLTFSILQACGHSDRSSTQAAEEGDLGEEGDGGRSSGDEKETFVEYHNAGIESDSDVFSTPLRGLALKTLPHHDSEDTIEGEVKENGGDREKACLEAQKRETTERRAQIHAFEKQREEERQTLKAAIATPPKNKVWHPKPSRSATRFARSESFGGPTNRQAPL